MNNSSSLALIGRKETSIKSFSTVTKLCGFIILLVFAFITSILIGSDLSRPNYYENLWILPLVYGIFSAFCFLFLPKDLIAVSVFGLFYLRDVVSVFFLKLGDYSSYVTDFETESVNMAILLILFESIVMVTYTLMKAKKKFATTSFPSNNYNRVARISPYLVLFVFLAFLVFVFAYRPQFFMDYESFFTSSNIRGAGSGSNSSGVLHTIFGVWFPIIYIFIALFLMDIVNRRFVNRFLKYIFNILLISVPLFFMFNADGFTIICLLSLSFVSLKANGISKKIFIIIICGGIIAIAIYLLLSAANLSFNADSKNIYQKASSLLQGYFPGISNYSGFFNMSKHDKLVSFFYDMYATIPYRNSIFHLTDDFRLAFFFNTDNGTSSQILPCGAQLFYYFSLLGIFIECLFVKYAYYFRNKYYQTKSQYLTFTYALICIYLVLTPIAYNFTNFMARFLITIVPLWLVFLFLKSKSTVRYI